jgi:hypothetical protein
MHSVTLRTIRKVNVVSLLQQGLHFLIRSVVDIWTVDLRRHSQLHFASKTL